MIDQRQRTIEALQQRVTKLNAEIKQVQDDYAALVKRQREDQSYAKMYRQLQTTVIENPSLQPLWDEFVVALRLVVGNDIG